MKDELASVESTGKESGILYTDLLSRQEAIATHLEAPANSAPAVSPSEELPATVDGLPYGKRRSDTKVSSVVESTIRVDVSLLNKLMNLVGELVLARNQIAVQCEVG